jgi:hypothetical protein
MSQAPCRKRSVHAGPSLSFLCVAVRYDYRGRSCSRRRDSHLTFHNLRESGLRGMGRAAVTVSRYDKVRSHIVAEQRNFRDVGSLLDRQDAAGVAAVLGALAARYFRKVAARRTCWLRSHRRLLC